MDTNTEGTRGPTGTTASAQLAGRSRIRAFRADRHLLIVAEGELPDPGFELDIAESPLRIFPQQYNLLRRRLPGFFPAVVVPYLYSEVVRFPVDRPTVTVHHADGQDAVEIQEYGEELAAFAAAVSDTVYDTVSDTVSDPVGAAEARGAVEAVGTSPRLSFDEAFADAVAGLAPEPSSPDALTRVVVTDTGALFGGLAGFHHLVVRIRRVPG